MMSGTFQSLTGNMINEVATEMLALDVFLADQPFSFWAQMACAGDGAGIASEVHSPQSVRGAAKAPDFLDVGSDELRIPQNLRSPQRPSQSAAESVWAPLGWSGLSNSDAFEANFESSVSDTYSQWRSAVEVSTGARHWSWQAEQRGTFGKRSSSVGSCPTHS